MHASIIAICAAAAASLVSGSPVKRQSCSVYPWFLAPNDAYNCAGTAATYEPNSGPETATPNNQTCQPLYQPNTTPISFPSVGVNPDACPDQEYTVYLYTTLDCSDEPTSVTPAECVNAPATGNFTMFSVDLYEAN